MLSEVLIKVCMLGCGYIRTPVDSGLRVGLLSLWKSGLSAWGLSGPVASLRLAVPRGWIAGEAAQVWITCMWPVVLLFL
jgi:hypothetical protein